MWSKNKKAMTQAEREHMGRANGWHGRKAMWRVMKMDELAALNETLRRVYGEAR